MSFTIQNLIIHEIDKSQPKKGQTAKPGTPKLVNVTTPAMPGDQWHTLLKTALASTDSDRRLQRGNFTASKGFKDDFEEYQTNIKDFITLTRDTTKDLLKEMNKVSMSTGGFILFAEIQKNNKIYFYCIMFKQKMGENLTFDNTLQRYDLKGVVFLDLDKMHQGFCLELDDYQIAKNNNAQFNNTGKPYLYFINMQAGNQTNTSDYFIDTFGCRVVENSAKSMKILLDKTVNTFKKEPKLAPYADDIKKQITTLYATCESTQTDIELNKVEVLMKVFQTKAGLSDTEFKPIIDGWFQDLVHSSDNPISASFSVNTEILNKMRLYKTTIAGFTISGDKETLLKSQHNDVVYYDRKNQKIIISIPQPIS